MYLDISNLFLFCLISIVIGAIVTLIVQVWTNPVIILWEILMVSFLLQYYIFMRFFKMNSDEAEATNSQTEIKKNSKFHMPEVSLISFKVSLLILTCFSNYFPIFRPWSMLSILLTQMRKHRKSKVSI